jgi:hypothetical protein
MLMLSVLQTILSHASDRGRCRRHRCCIPSLPERASCLEDRVLLSAVVGKARTAEIAQNPADTKVGREVTNLFESILHTDPTKAQLTRMVRELRGGMSIGTLHADLTAAARAAHGLTPAAVNAVVIKGDASAAARASSGSAAAGTLNAASMMPGLLATSNPIVPPINVSQMPPGMSVSISFAPAPVHTISFSPGSPAAPSTSGTTGPASIMTGMGTTGTSMPSTGSMGSTPATGAGMGTPGMMPSSPMAVAPPMFSPMMTAGM